MNVTGMKRAGWILALALLAPASAFAQDENVESSSGGGARSRGLGATMEALFTVANGFGGTAGLVYDLGQLRFGGGLALGVKEDSDTNFGLGATAWFALHRTQHADFSIGGGVGLSYLDPAGGGSGNVRVTFLGGGQIRAFVVDNVALMGTLGLGVSVGRGGFEFGIGGQIMGGVGLAYFF